MKKRIFILSCFFVFFISGAAFAGIFVSPSIVNFESGKLPRQDIKIVNNDDHDAYVKVKAYLVEDPGGKKQKNVLIENPEKLGLLVSPKMLIIPPHQNRVVRVMSLLSDLKKDKIYNLVISPVPNELLPVKTEKVDGRSIGIRVVVAYGVLVMARPENMKPDLKVKRTGKELLVKNDGNTNIVVTGGKQCSGEKCFELKPRRMYAGSVWKTKLDFAKPIEIYTDFLGKKGKIESN